MTRGDAFSPRCDFLILAAQNSELTSVLDLVDYTSEELSNGERLYHLRILHEYDGAERVLLGAIARSGIGRVEAAVTASRLLHLLSPPVLLLVGIAGGFLANGVALGDIVVAERIVDYEYQRWSDGGPEFRLRSFRTDERLLAESKSAAAKDWYKCHDGPDSDVIPRIHFGSMLSGDKVIASKSVGKSLLLQEPSVFGVEMEGAGVAAATARGERVRFLMIRGIVDLADDRKREDSRVWQDRTCRAVALFTIATLLEMR